MTEIEHNDESAQQDTGISPHLRNLEQTLLSRDWLETRSKFELMDLVQFLAEQLYKQSTTTLKPTSRRPPDIKFPMVGTDNLASFESIPAGAQETNGDSLKILMVGSKTASLNRGYRIINQAVIGRDDGSNNVDIDLSQFGPEVKGVSRRHAEFKVSGNKLYVVDLQSSNGTYLRGQRLEAGQAVAVPSGSVLSFGALHVQVQIIRD
ncbi:MAG: FHA domain-containing protein [Anaerolineales bacterium]|nr:FHA domain-containing protein [Anaerolineales bacterium]